MRGCWASGTRARRARSRRSGTCGGEGGGARAVASSACPGLAGILFWSRGRVGRARWGAGGREVEALGREAELRAHSGKGRE